MAADLSDPDALWARARVPQPLPAVLQDYILTSYPPVVDPRGRAASESLLRLFLLQEGLLDVLWPLIEQFRLLLGPGQTVWGFKLLPGGRRGLELYVYDPSRDASSRAKGRDNPRSVTRLVQGLAPVLHVDSRLDDDRLSYHMCSLELDARVGETRHSDGFRIYPTGDRRRHGYDGLSVHVAGDRLIRENTYLFFQARTELAQVREVLAASFRSGDQATRAELLDPVLLPCHTICFSSKAHGDALYYSRLDTAQLEHALAKWWPGPLLEQVQARRDDLAHLRWDVGIDFTCPATDPGQVHVDKIGVYGFL